MSGRATRATSALDRLKARTGNPRYSMARTGAGHFTLSDGADEPQIGGAHV